MSYTTADKVAVVEAFQGEQWLKRLKISQSRLIAPRKKVERGYLKPLGAFVWQFNATDASKRFE